MMQRPLFVTTRSEWRPPRWEDLPPDWRIFEHIGLDTETCDPELKTLGPGLGLREGSYLVGVSLCFDNMHTYYLPLHHEGGDNCDWDVLGYLRAQAARYSGTLVGANLPYDLGFLAAVGVKFPRVKWFRDVQVADPCIYELHPSYSLQAIGERWDAGSKDESMLATAAADYSVDPKAGLWQLPARYVGPYAEQDARLPLLILARQERVIADRGLQRIYDLESRVLPILARMRQRGVRVNTDRLGEIHDWAAREEAQALAAQRGLTNIELGQQDLWRAAALAPVLRQLGGRLGRTPTGKPRVDKQAFAELEHPGAQLIERARKMNKLRTTFVRSVQAHMIAGRIHCTYNQLRRQKADGLTGGAAYGRLSCEHPNLQQQPARDEFGAYWRSIYLPDTAQWCALDYSQQEPRMAIEFACRFGLPGAARAHDAYVRNPATDNHQMVADMAGIPRKQAKTILLGLMYGMGGGKLCAELGLPSQSKTIHGHRVRVAGEEGTRLLAEFDRRVPWLRQLARRTQLAAREHGCVVTLGGRHCHFPRERDGYGWTHKALNRLIQGSAADQTKTAMVALADCDMMAQVHDEVALDAEPADAREAARLMENCLDDMHVPSRVDVETGPSWGESMAP